MQTLCRYYANLRLNGLTLLLALLCCPAVWAQEKTPSTAWNDQPIGRIVVMPPPISLKESVKTAGAVFEGRVVGRYQITTESQKIHTCYVVEVYRIFKGNFIADTVEVITYTDWDTYRAEPTFLNESIWTHGIGIFFTNATTKFDAFTQSSRKKFQFYSPYYGFKEEIEKVDNPEALSYSAAQEMRVIHKSVAKYADKKTKVVKEIYKKKKPCQPKAK